MPVLDGLSATMESRDLPAPFCHVPIFALTADVLTKSSVSLDEMALDGYPHQTHRLAEPLQRHHAGAACQEGGCAAGQPPHSVRWRWMGTSPNPWTGRALQRHHAGAACQEGGAPQAAAPQYALEAEHCFQKTIQCHGVVVMTTDSLTDGPSIITRCSHCRHWEYQRSTKTRGHQHTALANRQSTYDQLYQLYRKVAVYECRIF